MPYIEFDNNRFYYAGNIKQGYTPVIFCHGSGGSHHHWLYQLKDLKDRAAPLAVDLPGHGRSEGTPANSIAVYREWLHRFCLEAGLGPSVFAGHSMGGAIALDYALNYPTDVLGLILVGSGGRLRVLPALLESLEKGSIPPTFFEFLYGPAASQDILSSGQKELENTPAATYYADLTACDNFDVMDELPRIKQPVLMICGSEDRLTPVKYSRYLEEALPRGQVEVIEGAGHMVMLEKPKEVNRAAADFIQQIQAQ